MPIVAGDGFLQGATKGPLVMSKLPCISVVTPSLNQCDFLGRALESVLDQGYPDLEYVVVDGGSTDGSATSSRQHQDRLTWWVSEPDNGLYHAVNKGFAHTSGEIMCWINSSDTQYPWTLATVAEVFDQLPEVEWILGVSSEFGLTGGPKKVTPAFFNVYDVLAGNYRWIQQESVFWRRSLWERAGGGLDESLPRVADFDLWLRFLRLAPLYHVETLLGGFRHHDHALGDQGGGPYEREAADLLPAFAACLRRADAPARAHRARRRPGPAQADRSDAAPRRRLALVPAPARAVRLRERPLVRRMSSGAAATDRLQLVFLIRSFGFPEGMAATNRVRLLGRALIDQDVDVSVLCTRVSEWRGEVRNTAPTGVADGIPYRYTTGSTIRSESFIRRRSVEARGYATAIVELERRRRQGLLDCVYVTALPELWSGGTWLLLRWLRRRGVPVVIELNEQPSDLTRLPGAISRVVSHLDAASGVVAISDWLAVWAGREAARIRRRVQIVEVPDRRRPRRAAGAAVSRRGVPVSSTPPPPSTPSRCRSSCAPSGSCGRATRSANCTSPVCGPRPSRHCWNRRA